MKTPSTSSGSSSLPLIAEVRYSLPQMLQELEIERAAGSFAMEKLGQAEIRKMFKSRKPPRRVKSRK